MLPCRDARELLDSHRKAWERKPILRRVYLDYFRRLAGYLAPGKKTLEIGSGAGFFKERYPATISSDLIWCPWLGCAADAMRLPVRTGSLDNIVMIDVFHHLPYPLRFLRGASRALRPGGRVLILDPYVSWASAPVYRFLHPEPMTMGIRPFEMPEDAPLFLSRGAFDSNMAISSVIYFRDGEKFRMRFPEFRVAHTSRFSSILYLLSGGFRESSFLPSFLRPALGLLERLDRWADRFSPMVGFRCIVVLEKR